MVSDALISQVDLLSSFATLTGQPLGKEAGPDSFDMLDALLGRSKEGREELVEHAGTLCLIRGDWKYIEPNNGPRINRNVNIELGNDPQPQLYRLSGDIGEKKNVAADHPGIVREMAALLDSIKQRGRSR